MLRNSKYMRFTSRFLCVLLVAMHLQGVARAGIVDTEDLNTQAQLQDKRNDIRALVERQALDLTRGPVVRMLVERQDVRTALVAKGVSPDEVMQRVNSLNTTELAMLHDKLDQLPAGQGALEVVLVVFAVLVITDLTGLTDVFPRI